MAAGYGLSVWDAMTASSQTVGVDFVHRVKTVYPFLVATGTPVLIASRLTHP